jgi:hypothetical protein
MHITLSVEVEEEVRKSLPLLREQLKKEFLHLDNYYKPCTDFYSNDKVIELLPCAAYEYILMKWGIEPTLVTMPSVIKALNDKLFSELPLIAAHALRRLATKQSSDKEGAQ